MIKREQYLFRNNYKNNKKYKKYKNFKKDTINKIYVNFRKAKRYRTVRNYKLYAFQKRTSIFKCKYFNRFIRYFIIDGKLDKAENIIFSVFMLLKESYLKRGKLFFYNIFIIIKPSFIMTPIIRPFAGKRVMYLPYRMRALPKYKAALRIFVKYIKDIKANKMLIAHSLEFTIAESLATLAFDIDQHPLFLKKIRICLN